MTANPIMLYEGTLFTISLLSIFGIAFLITLKNKETLSDLRDEIIRLNRSLSAKKSSEAGKSAASVPSELFDSIKKYDDHFSILAKVLKEHQQSSDISLEKMIDSISRQDGIMGGIRDYLAHKNELTERLQEGYDYRILKNFVKQIIRCIHQIDTSLSNELKTGSPSYLAMQNTRNELLDMLDRQGIEKILPDVGASFSDLRKIAEVVPQKEPTTDKQLVGKIASIIRPGYRYMIQQDRHRVLVPAQVKVYELSRSN